MVKNKNAPYKAGLRIGTMAKIKEMKEDLDLVILAAEHGKGKRAGFYSSFVVGVKNDNSCRQEEAFLEVGKVASGIKEIGEIGATLSHLTSLLKPLTLKEEKNLTYFEPKIILQVRYQEIQKSPSSSSGYALRFPRIIELRTDKTLEEINSLNEVKNWFENQE